MLLYDNIDRYISKKEDVAGYTKDVCIAVDAYNSINMI